MQRPTSCSNFERAPENHHQEQEDISPRTEFSGYRIERQLGRGGMGAVYLARQLSLDRTVALKVMSRRWSSDPVFVARFTREAYAAAQLNHPNIVQIHDIGEVEGSHFFSMEYVRGRSLADLIRKHGKLDPETAVGYVLQAARGLKHAHDRGMIHRDVKPDNLLLDDRGIVKVADLGLVKTPYSSRSDDALGGRSTRGLSSLPHDMTEPMIALGTPAYMSPEQCRDAATVDHRADIYSLGCTLYVLVTGRPPFDGTTAVELMSKHAYEMLVPPEQIVSRVPKEISSIIQRMMAKNADDRYGSAGELIRDLEAWLGVRTAGTFAPSENQINRIEAFAARLNGSPITILRARLLKGFFTTLAIATVLLLFTGQFAWATGMCGLALQFTLAYFLVDGFARKGPLFIRVRQLAYGLGWCDWAFLAAGVALFALLLATFGVFMIWLGCGLVGVGLAFALRHGLDRKIDAERQPIIDGCEQLLRRLRAQGLAEDDLRGFVAKFAGRHWEGLFEALFGYEAKLAIRTSLLSGGAYVAREKYGVWREPLIALIERIETTRREGNVRKLLASVEQARFQAAGAPSLEAVNKANAAASAMVREADKIRKSETQRVRIRDTTHAAHPAPVQVGNLVRGGSNPEFICALQREPESRFVGLFVGSPVRVVLSALLLAGFGLWIRQNGLFPDAGSQARTASALHPLTIEGVPNQFTDWIDGINVGIAGLIVLGSLFYRGNTMGAFVILGAAVVVTGHRFGIRSVGALQNSHIAIMLGVVLSLVGFRDGGRWRTAETH